ncbi:CLUMA_CG001056, isoform A [Clunio marinus]|uniref:CLUMA_CG001056, isoform A n=1 Tax=Clunio marinus TaxID=568069 RepID=A0A1J1HLC9_9DIPT|nr:CLUMA_CG001056, isoform A [Clunio marinus]
MKFYRNLKIHLHALRRLMQGGPDHPKAPLGNNFRPPQPLLHRPVRTNIDFRSKQPNGKACPTMYKDVHYKGEATFLLLGEKGKK